MKKTRSKRAKKATEEPCGVMSGAERKAYEERQAQDQYNQKEV